MIVVTDSCVFEEGGRVVFESNKAGAATAGLGFVLESLLRVWVTAWPSNMMFLSPEFCRRRPPRRGKVAYNLTAGGQNIRPVKGT